MKYISEPIQICKIFISCNGQDTQRWKWHILRVWTTHLAFSTTFPPPSLWKRIVSGSEAFSVLTPNLRDRIKIAEEIQTFLPRQHWPCHHNPWSSPGNNCWNTFLPITTRSAILPQSSPSLKYSQPASQMPRMPYVSRQWGSQRQTLPSCTQKHPAPENLSVLEYFVLVTYNSGHTLCNLIRIKCCTGFCFKADIPTVWWQDNCQLA